MQKRDIRGFTIVELLIVIVVIAILAAVTTVAYSGLKARAVNSRTSQSLEVTEKAINLYRADVGKPLYVQDEDIATWGLNGNQYYLGGNAMTGYCLTQSWPSRTEMVNDIDPNDDWLRAIGTSPTDYYIYGAYCGAGSGEYQMAMTDTIKKTSVAGAFAKMPMASPVTVISKRADNSGNDTYTFRGIRYAFNGSFSSPVTYLYYALNGKKCLGSDVSIRVQSTINIGIGPGGSFAGFTETGGDYTANDSIYCMKETKG